MNLQRVRERHERARKWQFWLAISPPSVSAMIDIDVPWAINRIAELERLGEMLYWTAAHHSDCARSDFDNACTCEFGEAEIAWRAAVPPKPEGGK